MNFSLVLRIAGDIHILSEMVNLTNIETDKVLCDMNVMPSFEEVEQALSFFKAQATAAEAHGLLCGMICSGPKMDGKLMLEPMLREASIAPEIRNKGRAVLLQLYEVTNRYLHDFEFDFQLLLPDDEIDLESRAEALSQWCQGFIMGLDAAGIRLDQNIVREAKDALESIKEIAIIDHEQFIFEKHDESDEKAFFEITEYLRLAVLMVYHEFSGCSQTRLKSRPETLH